MPDDFEPDVAGGGGDEPSPVDETTPTPEGEPAEPEGDVPAEEASSPDDEQTPAAGGSEKLKNLLAKYGDDPDKMVDAYWEQAKSLSALDKKLDALIDKVNSRQESPEEEAKQIASDPDVSEIGAELASLDADVKRFEADDKQLVGQYGQLDIEIKQLQAKLEFAPDEITKQNLNQEIREKAREQRDVGREWKANQNAIKATHRQMQGFVRQYREAEIRAKAKREQAKKQEWSDRAASEGTRKEYASAIRTEAESYGIALDSRTYGVLNQSVRDRLVNYLLSLGPEAEGVDIPTAVGALVKEYADVMKLKKSFSTASRQKAGLAGKPGVAPQGGSGKAPPTDKSGKYWHPDYVRERAKRMLG